MTGAPAAAGRTTLVTTPTFARHADAPWTLLADGGAGPLRPCGETAMPPQELPRHLAGADALIAGMDHITAEVMDAAPRLKAIAKHGVGTDTIDPFPRRAPAAPASPRTLPPTRPDGVTRHG